MCTCLEDGNFYQRKLNKMLSTHRTERLHVLSVEKNDELKMKFNKSQITNCVTHGTWYWRSDWLPCLIWRFFRAISWYVYISLTANMKCTNVRNTNDTRHPHSLAHTHTPYIECAHRNRIWATHTKCFNLAVKTILRDSNETLTFFLLVIGLCWLLLLLRLRMLL